MAYDYSFIWTSFPKDVKLESRGMSFHVPPPEKEGIVPQSAPTRRLDCQDSVLLPAIRASTVSRDCQSKGMTADMARIAHNITMFFMHWHLPPNYKLSVEPCWTNLLKHENHQSSVWGKWIAIQWLSTRDDGLTRDDIASCPGCQDTFCHLLEIC